MQSASSVLLLACALGGSCVGFEEHPLAPEAAAADLESRSLADEGLRGFLEANLGGGEAPWPPARQRPGVPPHPV